MKLQIQVDDDGVISDVKFKAYGCGSAIASSSYATTYLKGKNIQQALKVSNQEIADYLSLPPIKLHCSILAEDAVRRAVEDYLSKNPTPSIEEDIPTLEDDVETKITNDIRLEGYVIDKKFFTEKDQFLDAIKVCDYPKESLMDKNAPIKITSNAFYQMSSLILKETNHSSVSGMLVQVVSGGCAGSKYVIEYADMGKSYDKYEIIFFNYEDKKLNIFIDPKTLFFINGIVIDYQVEELFEGFTFTNPNENGRCGCGSSFY